MELKPLFQILEGESHITSLRQLTHEASDVLRKVEKAIQAAQLNRFLSLYIYDLVSSMRAYAILNSNATLP